MKKGFIFLLFLTMVFTLSACNPEPVIDDPVVLTDAEKILEAQEALTLGNIDSLIENITLPTSGLHDVVITWESNNPAAISNDGVVVRALFEDGDKYIQLVATLSYGGITLQKAFNATVISLDEVIIPNTDEADVAYDKENLLDGINLNVTEDLTLPTRGEKGSYISWASSDERLISTRGHINRPGFIEGDETVTLTASLRNGEFDETKDFVFNLVKEDDNLVTSTVSFPFESLADEYIVASGNANIYYMNNGNLPYIDVQDFITLLTGAIVSDELSVVGVGDQLTVSYIIDGGEDEDDYYMEMLYDFTQNTLSINDFSFFDGISEETQTDFGTGLETVNYVSTDPNVVTIDFDDYDFDLVVHNDKYLIPFHFANLFYSGGMYDVYYNGDKLWGVDTYQLMDDDTVGTTVMNSSLNTEDMPNDLKEASYDFVIFIFDYFYGLREEQEVESYYDEFSIYYSNFVNSDDRALYKAIFRAAYSRDDLHTSHMFSGYYESNYELNLMLSDLGPNSQEYYETYWDLEDACDSKSAYRVIDGGKIGIIFIDGFEAETPDEFEASLNALLALGTVESIVIDLTCNGGGILGSTFQILGFLTDEPIGIHSKDVTSGATESWFMSTENTAADVDWYILTSGVTFSAANLMTSVAKDMGIATIVGQNSSGGACSIAAILTPDGSGLLISSTGMLTDSRYDSIESGIEVDYYMENVNSNTELIAIINGN